MDGLEIQILGGFQLKQVGKELLGVESARQRALLVYLLVHRDSPQSRQHLAYLFWPDSSDAQALTNLRQLLYRLRQDLPQLAPFVRVEHSTLQWHDEAAVHLDLALFEDALGQAQSALDAGEEEKAISALHEAIGAYGGELLPDCYDEWILPLRERVHQQYVSALEQLSALLETRGDYEGAIPHARALLAQDDLQESGYRRLMRLHLLAGNRAAALRVYHNCVTVFETEFGIEPGAETRQVYEQVVASKLPPRERTTNGTPAPSTSLVGRQAEWQALQDAWRRAGDGTHMAILAGEAGIGQSHLAEHLCRWASRRGIATAMARCYSGEGRLAYAPIAAWLRSEALRSSLARLDDVWLAEIARLAPDLAGEYSLPEGSPSSFESWHQQRFFDGLARAFFAVREPLILVLDDMHWADRATLEWLTYFITGDGDKSLLVVGTVRDESVEDRQLLDTFRWRLMGAGQLTEIALRPLDPEETLELATNSAGTVLNPAFAERLYRETEGNPLFVVESARSARTGGAATVQDGFISPRIQAVIEARLNQLSPEARDVADLAAALNSQFSFDVLAQAGDFGEEALVNALDELWRRRVVREVDEEAYDFAHGKIREVAYAGLSRARRRLLHRRLADALSQLHAQDAGIVSAHIAKHYEKGGDPSKALEFYERAAEEAAGLYAYAEAEALYGRAIAIASRLTTAGSQLAQLYAQRGRMLEHAGRFDDAVVLYRKLQALGERRNDSSMVGLALARLVSCYIEPNAVHDLEAAEPLIDRGLAVVRELGDAALEADLLWSQMIRETHYGNTTIAQEIGERCLTIARKHGLQRLLGLVLHDLALNLRLTGAIDHGAAYAEEAQDIFRRRGNLGMLADSLNQRGLMHILHLELAEAGGYVAEAKQISERINNRWNLAYSAWLQGLIWSLQGRWGQALAAFQESEEYGQEIGFLMSLTSVRASHGNLLRQIGDLEGARALHLSAHEAGAELAPFMLRVIESELARDAIAANEAAAGQKWLRQAGARPWLGDIARALFLSSPGLARTEMARLNDDWEVALEEVEKALQDSRRRGLVWHESSLLLAQGCCWLALGKTAEAEGSLRQALQNAEHAGAKPLCMQSRALLARLHGVQHGQQRESLLSEDGKIAADVARELAATLPEERQEMFLQTPGIRAILQPGAADAGWPFPLFN
ncbi:MAG: ATP-binding protein [Chloroflexota bacterium]